MKPHFAHSLARLLLRRNIPGANLEAADAAVQLRDAPRIFQALLPKRTIHFDAECIGDAGDIERVVARFADATEGAWALQELGARWSHTAEKGFVDFKTGGAPFHWEFQQIGDFVSQGLLDNLQAFACAHLPGNFVEVPTPDQCYCAVYLERPAAQELRELLAQYEQEFSFWL